MRPLENGKLIIPAMKKKKKKKKTKDKIEKIGKQLKKLSNKFFFRYKPEQHPNNSNNAFYINFG